MDKETNNPILPVAHEILSKGTIKSLQKLKLSINKSADQYFPEVVRMLVAVSHNKKLERFSLNIAEKALNFLEELSIEVENQAGDYPKSSIKAHVWINGYALWEWSDILPDFFEKKDLLSQKVNVLLYKCRITESIMSHYPETIGPDMIALGEALEKVNLYQDAIKYYRSIILDFERIAVGFYENPEESLREEDIISLNCLIKACTNVESLDAQSNYTEKISSLEHLLNTREKSD